MEKEDAGNVFAHRPVLLNEAIEGLNIRPDGIYVDGTAGGGGHSYEIAGRLEKGKLFCLDQDGEAVAAVSERLRVFGDRVVVRRENYINAASVLGESDITAVDGVLLDLGVSSFQLDTARRGFSYRFDAPLDMRMDDRAAVSARDIVNGYSERELARIIREYGEERFAGRIAANIVKERALKPIETTYELNDIIKDSIPARMREKGGHPSKRTFQAIRIACNRELEVLEEALGMFEEILSPGGRLCVITFHSLEDRIVKNAFRRFENPCTCPPELPVCVCGKVPTGKVITKHPIIPSDEERESNPRASSAKLRIFERN